MVENEKLFEQKFKKHVNKKSIKGLGLAHVSLSSNKIYQALVDKLKVAKSKVKLVKSIVDFTYPEIILKQLKVFN